MQYRIQTYTYVGEDNNRRGVKHGVLVFALNERQKFLDTLAALETAGIEAQSSIRVFSRGKGYLDFPGDKLRHVAEALAYMADDVKEAMYPKPQAVAAE